MHPFRQIVRGIAALVHGRAADRDIDDEVHHYLDETARAHERHGLSHPDALRAARLDLGNVTVVREQVRAAGWEHTIETFFADVHYALRRLRRSPAFTVAATITLALGIGASTAIFSAISPVLLEPLPFPHASRIVSVDDRTNAGAPMPVTFGTFAEMRARSRSFDAIAAVDGWQPSITNDGNPERLSGQQITAGFFDVFGVVPAIGRAFTANDEQPGGARVAILSDGLLRRRFAGDRSIVGRTIDLNGDPYTVIGIMPAGFLNVVPPHADVWSPLRDRADGDFSTRAWGHHYKMVARLAASSTIETATRELATIGRAPQPTFARPPWARLENGLLVRSMRDDVAGPVKPSLFAIAGAVLVLLLIAAVNVTNLLLARGAQRRSELAMRTALGAGRGRIVRQLLTESVVLTFVGGALGLLVAYFGVGSLVAISPPGLPRVEAIQIDGRVFLFALALTTLVGIGIGLVPALGSVRAEVTAGLHQAARTSATRSRSRGVLVVAEVALAVVLLVGAGLLYRSVTRLIAVPPGFDPSRVVTMQVIEAGHGFDSDQARLQFYQQALSAVQRVPGVTTAAFTSQLPLSGDVDGYGLEVQSIPTSAGGAGGSAMRYAVTADYFRAMGIPLRQGRLIGADDRAGGPESVVINESLARQLFGTRNPIGERVRFGPEMNDSHGWDYVVGVVGDVKHYSLAADAPNAFYIMGSQWAWVDNVQTLVVRTSGDAAALVPALQRAVWSIDGHEPIQRVRTMDSFVAASAGQRRFALLVIETFAIVALVLAAVGLYGVIAAGVIERLREIGIRSALGAQPSMIVGAVVRRSLLLSGAGALIGVVAALGTSRFIVSLLFGITRTDPTTYAGVVALLVLIAVIAAWMPARRAAGIDPTMALRAD